MRGTAILTLVVLAGCARLADPGTLDLRVEVEEDDDESCETVEVFYDADGDGFGDPATAHEVCSVSPGEVTGAGDCDDTDMTIHPAAIEHCDGVDENCDGTIDDGAVDAPTWYADADKDGYGGLRLATSCSPVPGGTTDGGDCDDLDAAVHPGARDLPCDGIDSDCDGDSGGGPVTVGGTDYASIQAGLNAAPAGATVLVCPGTYVESLSISKDVRLEGVTGDPADASVEPASGRAVEGRAATIELVGLTFRGGTDDYGGGNASVSTYDLLVDRCAFEDGWAGYEGGGLTWFGAGGPNPTIEVVDSRFSDNYAEYSGGGLETASWDAYTVILTDVSFDGNEADYEGGGAALSTLMRDAPDSVTMRLDGVTFTDNTAAYSGGGLDIGGWRLNDVEITDSHFEGNVSDYEGGGAAISGWSPTDARLIDTTFVDNESPSGAALTVGSWSDDVLSLDSCVVEDHSCGDCTSVAIGGWGGADVSVTDSRFSRNSNGIQIGGRGTTYAADVSGTTFEDTSGGAVLSISGAATVRGGVVRRNNAGLSIRGDLTLDKVDLASGSDDNVEYDVASPGAASFYPGVTSLVCVGGVCSP